MFSEVEVRARNVEDCSSGEVWIQYLEVLIGGYVIRLERILGASVAPARVTVSGVGDLKDTKCCLGTFIPGIFYFYPIFKKMILYDNYIFHNLKSYIRIVPH